MIRALDLGTDCLDLGNRVLEKTDTARWCPLEYHPCIDASAMSLAEGERLEPAVEALLRSEP